MHNDNLQRLGQLFWQFEIAGVPLPHVKARGKIGRRAGEWRLKVWGERLLFCADDAPVEIFAIATPCAEDADLIELWRAAIGHGDFGELTMTSREMGRPYGFSTFLILRANHGKSWARDWCGGEWVEFKGPKWQPNSTAPNSQCSLAGSQSGAMIQIWKRSFFESERQEQALLWLRGSFAEWKRVLQACATIHYCKNPTDSINFKVDAGARLFAFSAWTPSQQASMDGIDDYDNWSMPVEWEPIFLRNFVPVGWDWECFDRDEKSTRSSWQVEASIFSTPIQLQLRPSQHEQLEAQFFLRDWLRGKVPAHQIENLIG